MTKVTIYNFQGNSMQQILFKAFFCSELSKKGISEPEQFIFLEDGGEQKIALYGIPIGKQEEIKAVLLRKSSNYIFSEDQINFEEE